MGLIEGTFLGETTPPPQKHNTPFSISPTRNRYKYNKYNNNYNNMYKYK